MGNTNSTVDPDTIQRYRRSADSFWKLGVKLSYFDEFSQAVGGVEKLRGLSTGEVCELIIKPLTGERNLSYCEMLFLENHPAVGLCEVFVSHAWQCSFLETVEILQFHFRSNPDVILWFDLFSVNQTASKSERERQLTFDNLFGKFKTGICDVGDLVLVMPSWSSPTPLTRAWVLLELYCCSSGGARFDVAMAAGQRAQLLRCLAGEGSSPSKDMFDVKEVLASICCEKSTCSLESDAENILQNIEEEIGFENFDKMVRISFASLLLLLISSSIIIELSSLCTIIIINVTRHHHHYYF
jgi:hypothetical protein